MELHWLKSLLSVGGIERHREISSKPQLLRALKCVVLPFEPYLFRWFLNLPTTSVMPMVRVITLGTFANPAVSDSELTGPLPSFL